MAPRGRKPDPAAVKAAKGNPGRRPIGADPVVSAGDVVAQAQTVAPPLWLKGNGLKVWQRLAPRLVQMKLLSVVDSEAFGRYCRNFARWEKMQSVLDDEGETYESESAHGKLKRAHPAFLISDRLERQLLSMEDRFGLNPAERQRIYAERANKQFQRDLFAVTPVGQQPGAGKQPVGEQMPTHRPANPVGFLN